jgi:hypothetical protein
MRKQSLRRIVVLALAGFATLGTAAAWAQPTFNFTVFADMTDKENKDKATGTKSADSGVGVDVKRFYFTATHQFDSVWSAQFQSDIGDQGAKRYDVFVKKAYVQAKVAPELSFRLGSANTPWVPFVEELYGFRYVQQVLVDRLNFGTSADWGLHALGEAGGKTVNYAAGALNGRGYSNPTRSKSVDFEGRLGVNFSGLNLAVGGYTGHRGLETFAAKALHTATRFDALAAYVSDSFRVGGEYFQADNWNNVTTVAKDKADGFSGWASFAFTPALAAFGRYDSAKPSKTLNSALKDNYFNLGLQWRANKSFAASLAYKNEEVKNGSISTTDGTIGSTSKINKGTYNEIGVWTLYTF